VPYEANPKHKEPWQSGRKGSLCPTRIDEMQRDALFAASVAVGQIRYATDGEKAFAAQQHDAAADLWHGYPVGWKEVPESLRREWVHAGHVRRRCVRQHWEQHEDAPP
jgi:hypothetical protein